MRVGFQASSASPFTRLSEHLRAHSGPGCLAVRKCRAPNAWRTWQRSRHRPGRTRRMLPGDLPSRSVVPGRRTASSTGPRSPSSACNSVESHSMRASLAWAHAALFGHHDDTAVSLISSGGRARASNEAGSTEDRRCSWHLHHLLALPNSHRLSTRFSHASVQERPFPQPEKGSFFPHGLKRVENNSTKEHEEMIMSYAAHRRDFGSSR